MYLHNLIIKKFISDYYVKIMLRDRLFLVLFFRFSNLSCRESWLLKLFSNYFFKKILNLIFLKTLKVWFSNYFTYNMEF